MAKQYFHSMLIKINRQQCLEKYPLFPVRWYNEAIDELDLKYPDTVSYTILLLPSKTFKGHSRSVGIEWTHLMKQFGFDRLLFLGDMETPWLYQENDYPPVQEALQFLQDNKVGKRFNGGFEVTLETLPVFIKHLAWLSRCNAALPSFYFTDKGQNILANICQYGNLHVSTLNKKTDATLKALVPQSKFTVLTDRMCYERFSSSGAIKARELKL